MNIHNIICFIEKYNVWKIISKLSSNKHHIMCCFSDFLDLITGSKMSQVTRPIHYFVKSEDFTVLDFLQTEGNSTILKVHSLLKYFHYGNVSLLVW